MYHNWNRNKKEALAGVGKPIKPSIWRVSMLNLAKRNAENKGMSQAVYASSYGCKH